MSIIITLRTSSAQSHYKATLLKLLSFPSLTEIVICSGYFQEGGWGYSVSNDDILDTIKANPNFLNITLTIIGGQFKDFNSTGKPFWQQQFDNFLNVLKNEKIHHIAYMPKSKNWHAKVVIGLEQGIPKVAIIGSSNLTRPAYSEPCAGFNYECDVTLLSNDNSVLTHFAVEQLANENPLSPIITTIDPKIYQPDIDERLQGIYDEIIKDDDLESYIDY